MILRPQPRFPEPDTQPFWDATRKKELKYQICNACKNVIFYPRAHCYSCGALDSSWHTSRGEGVIYTYSVVLQNRHIAFKDLGAYAVAYVDLDEGFRILTNVVGVADPIGQLSCGMKVKIFWLDQGEEEISLPLFKPAT